MEYTRFNMNNLFDVLTLTLLLSMAVLSNKAMSLTAQDGLDDCTALVAWDKSGYSADVDPAIMSKAARCANTLGMFRSMSDNGLLSVKFCIPKNTNGRALTNAVVNVGRFVEKKSPEAMKDDIEYLYHVTMMTMYSCQAPSHPSETSS